LAFLVLACLPGLAAAEEILAPARVIDGDTVDVAGLAIRLEGIDAPELAQTCRDAGGGEVACGRDAARHLEMLIGGREILCTGTARDGYGRLIARCDAGSGDLGRQMVADGAALAFAKFSDAYAAEEAMARKAGTGLWAMTFETPWDWRAGRWAEAVAAAPDQTCPIKGNIARDGRRLYHMPGSRDYLRTRIDAAKGERWFCDEAAAIAAGWVAAH
jgi:endonuclease YncB( thermonuclease family)